MVAVAQRYTYALRFVQVECIAKRAVAVAGTRWATHTPTAMIEKVIAVW